MYMNLKPTIMTSLGFIAPSPKILGPPLNLAPPPHLIFCSGPPQLFWSEIFRSPSKIGGGGCYHDMYCLQINIV